MRFKARERYSFWIGQTQDAIFGNGNLPTS